MPAYRNADRQPRDLSSGRVLAPGETAEDGAVDPSKPHDKALIEAGSLIAVGGGSGQLSGKALDDRARELGIEGRSKMDADELRAAVAEADAAGTDEEDD